MVLRPFQLEIVFASWLSVVEYRAVDVSFKWKALRISIRTVTFDAVNRPCDVRMLVLPLPVRLGLMDATSNGATFGVLGWG